MNPTPRTRPSGLLGLVLVGLVLVGLPILEVWVLIQIGQQIGVLPTIGLIIVTAVAGAWLVKREGAKAWSGLRQALATGQAAAGSLADAALVLVGGVLLLLPGFVTDVFGLIFLLPITRPLARRWLGIVVSRNLKRRGIDPDVIRAKADPSQTIPGEVVADGEVSS